MSTLPVSSLGLCMDKNVIQVAVRLQLGLPLCKFHHCRHCGTEVDSLGSHGLNCSHSRRFHPRHAEINGIILRSLGSAKIPCHLEPTGLYRLVGKRPDGASIVPRKGVKCWCGILPARTPWPPPTVQLQPNKWGQWQARPRE